MAVVDPKTHKEARDELLGLSCRTVYLLGLLLRDKQKEQSRMFEASGKVRRSFKTATFYLSLHEEFTIDSKPEMLNTISCGLS